MEITWFFLSCRLALVLKAPGEETHALLASRVYLGPTMPPFVFPFPNLVNSLYTHMSCHGVFLVGIWKSSDHRSYSSMLPTTKFGSAGLMKPSK
jgi:hypothetical protein